MQKEETIVVSALRPLNSMPIKLAYAKDGNTTFINRSGMLITMPSDEFAKKMSNKEEAEALAVAYLRFKAAKKGKNGELSYSYKVKVDEEGTIIEPDKAVKDQAFGIFFSHCPFAEIDGVTGEYPALVSVKYINKSKKTEAVDTKKNLRIANIIEEMNLAKLQEVCALLAIPSFGRTKEEIFSDLTNFKSGYIYSEHNMKLFCDTYLDEQLNLKTVISSDAELKILVERAKEHNVIRITHRESQKEYWFSDTLLGYDDANVLLFLKKDDNMRRAIKLQTDIKMESSGVSVPKEVLPAEAHAQKAEDLTTMREALNKIRKSDTNPDGVWDIGKKAIHVIPKADIEEAYKKYILKQ